MNYSSEKKLKHFGFNYSSPAIRNKKKWQKNYVPKNFKNFGFDFFDGNSLGIGYAGYKYKKIYFDKVAKNLIKKFNLTSKSKVLDIGCAKGCLIYDLYRSGIQVKGLDVSFYAKNKSVPQMKNKISLIPNLNFLDEKYDLIISLNVFNYFEYSKIDKVIKAIRENSKNNFLIIETVSSSKNKKNFLCSDPNYKISETKDWWENKLRKLNFSTENVFFRDLS